MGGARLRNAAGLDAAMRWPDNTVVGGLLVQRLRLERLERLQTFFQQNCFGLLLERLERWNVCLHRSVYV